LDLFPGASQNGVGFRVDIGGGKTMRPLKNVGSEAENGQKGKFFKGFTI
jgi:hypothetical protein